MEALRRQSEPVINSSEAVSVGKAGGAGSSVHDSQTLKIDTPSRSLSPIRLPLLGECQRENCALAVAALDNLAEMLSFEPAFKAGLETVSWRSRFQTVETDPRVILDGAHNPSSARALVQTLKEVYPAYKVGFVLGFLNDKDAIEFVHAIKPHASAVWTVPINTSRGMTAAQSAAQVRAAGLEAVPLDTAQAWQAACGWASEEPERLICITGSLYLAGVPQGLHHPSVSGSGA